jgi:hypothetical protein
MWVEMLPIVGGRTACGTPPWPMDDDDGGIGPLKHSQKKKKKKKVAPQGPPPLEASWQNDNETTFTIPIPLPHTCKMPNPCRLRRDPPIHQIHEGFDGPWSAEPLCWHQGRTTSPFCRFGATSPMTRPIEVVAPEWIRLWSSSCSFSRMCECVQFPLTDDRGIIMPEGDPDVSVHCSTVQPASLACLTSLVLATLPCQHL